MIRPKGKALEIAKKVVPYLKLQSQGVEPKNRSTKFLSEVEVKQTNNIRNQRF